MNVKLTGLRLMSRKRYRIGRRGVYGLVVHISRDTNLTDRSSVWEYLAEDGTVVLSKRKLKKEVEL
jgi:hypothetical protein